MKLAVVKPGQLTPQRSIASCDGGPEADRPVVPPSSAVVRIMLLRPCPGPLMMFNLSYVPRASTARCFKHVISACDRSVAHARRGRHTVVSLLVNIYNLTIEYVARGRSKQLVAHALARSLVFFVEFDY